MCAFIGSLFEAQSLQVMGNAAVGCLAGAASVCVPVTIYLRCTKTEESGSKQNGHTVPSALDQDFDFAPELSSRSQAKSADSSSLHFPTGRQTSEESTSSFRGTATLRKRKVSLDEIRLKAEERRKIYGLGGYSQQNRVILCMVGLPARGKSYIVKMLTRYLQWTGFPVKAFNAGNLRRKEGMAGADAKFFSATDQAAIQRRENIATQTMEEAFSWLNVQDGVSVAIFDATNTTRKRRKVIIDRCHADGGITPVFIESICEDPKILEQNYSMKLDNDDYRGMDQKKARADFLERVKIYEARYETIEDNECDGDISYMKLFNVGQKVVMHKCSGYVMSNIGFYLSNIHISPRRIWLMRHAETEESVQGVLGSIQEKLTDRGVKYSHAVAKFIYEAASEMKKAGNGCGAETIILTGTAPVHHATSEALHSKGNDIARATAMYPLMSTSLLNELDGGDCNGMSYKQIQEEFPDIWREREQDKLNFRYPGAGGESYVDVIHRLAPVIIELERQRRSILIISHLAVQRCLFAYFANTPMQELPYLEMDMHTLYELQPSPHGTQVTPVRLGDG